MVVIVQHSVQVSSATKSVRLNTDVPGSSRKFSNTLCHREAITLLLSIISWLPLVGHNSDPSLRLTSEFQKIQKTISQNGGCVSIKKNMVAANLKRSAGQNIIFKSVKTYQGARISKMPYKNILTLVKF